jgi:hypothetical protein
MTLRAVRTPKRQFTWPTPNVVVAEEGVRAAAMYLRVGVSLGRSCDADKGGGGQQGYK